LRDDFFADTRFLPAVFFDAVFFAAGFLPEPDFFPPPLISFAVAHARRSASAFETPLRS
jgi:hypothetical protein